MRPISFLGVFLVAACGTDDVIVATLPEGPPADANSGGCSTNEDCPADAFCARTNCSDSYGECQVRPAFCDAWGMPFCGCDGVTYWNDCLRQQYGATASVSGSCATGAAPCTDENALDCPVIGAACAKLFPPGPTCPLDTPGVCWVLPVECPMDAPPDRFSACGEEGMCREPCSAIRTGRPHRRDVTHSCPPGGGPGPGGR